MNRKKITNRKKLIFLLLEINASLKFISIKFDFNDSQLHLIDLIRGDIGELIQQIEDDDDKFFED